MASSMIQQRLSHSSYDHRLIKAAGEITESGSCAVSKSIRAGMTTSVVLACEERGKVLMVVAPTRRILQETIENASNVAVRIPANSECEQIQLDIQKNPVVRVLPLSLSDCKKCKFSDRCEVLEILRSKDPRVVTLTYAKFVALILSRGSTAQKILAKISSADVIMFDEAHFLSLPPAVRVRAFASVKIPDKYTTLERIYQMWQDFCLNHNLAIQDLMERAKEGHSSKHLSKSLFNVNRLEFITLKAAWDQLRKVAVAHELPNDEILMLRDIISIMSTNQVSINYISEKEGECGAIYVLAGQGWRDRAINEFLTKYASHAKILFVSGTLFERYEGYFSDMAGRKIKNVIFPDLRNATAKLTLISDSWTLTSKDFFDKLPQILDAIKAITEREKQTIYLIAQNARKASRLRKEIAKLGLKDIFVDYYRSFHSLGVERTERICIAIGMAETPANACDALARGNDSDEKWLDSRRLRRQEVDAATWQAVNRVRDPEGKVESKVYFIGCRVDRICQAATWGTNRNLVVKSIKERKGSNGETIKVPTFEVEVDEKIELPKIYAEQKNASKPERRSLKDYIESIGLYNFKLINSEKHDISSIHINRENVVKLRIYNIPQNENELDLTSKSLYSMFVNRTDCYALQHQNSRSGKWEFSKVLSSITEDKIKQHVKGEVTLGVYEIGLDDMVTWCCDDIDSHNGESDAREKVARLVAVCRKYGIPYLLEASGSIDSYHLWIPLSKTSTYNAFRFIRQLNAEANVKCECWPKQKSLKDKNGKYGNLVKMPVCYHNKSKSRSAFLDADTFEPLEGPISHPGLVHLLEIPDLSESSSKGIPKRCKKRGSSARSAPNSGNKLRYCMQRALDDRLSLTGAEGHNFRLAIACEGRAIGMPPESVALLFQVQKDFNYEISLKKSREPETYDYSPWSCGKLKDLCFNLVSRYCNSCPLNHATRAEASA